MKIFINDPISKLGILLIYFLFSAIALAQPCPPADTTEVSPPQNLWDIPGQNNWQGLEVMTWNLKQFPTSSYTVSYVNEIISDMLPDVIVFQEISALDEFQNLIDALPAYTFIHTNYGDGEWYDLNLAIAVRSDCVDILNYTTLFPYDGWEFAWRYPLMANLRWSCGDSVLEFQLIAVHFKCCEDGFERRLASSVIIRDYIRDLIDSEQELNIIVAGDFNDDIDDPEYNNSLWPLVDDPEYVYFTTTPIVGDYSQQSYPWYYASFIDHILISSGLFDENEYGEVQTIRLDDYLGSNTYQNNISDHRPVIWRIFLESMEVPTGLVINEIMNNPMAVSDTYGEWFELTNIGSTTVNLNNLIIKDDDTDQHIISSTEPLLIEPGAYFLLGRETDPALNGGLQLDYEYSNINLSNTWDEIIIEHPLGMIIDEVYYDNGATFPDPEGASMMLTSPELDNASGGNWTISTADLGNGDFGTPGMPNVLDENCVPNGDVDQDQVLDVIDLVTIVGYIMGSIEFDPTQICIADVNENGSVDIVDIVIIVSYIMN